MIIELEINGARVIVSGENLSVNVSQTEECHPIAARPRVEAAGYPTEETIRASLLQAAEAHGEALTTICRKVGMDTHFLLRVRDGENFSVKTYQRVMDWLLAEKAVAA